MNYISPRSSRQSANGSSPPGQAQYGTPRGIPFPTPSSLPERSSSLADASLRRQEAEYFTFMEHRTRVIFFFSDLQENHSHGRAHSGDPTSYGGSARATLSKEKVAVSLWHKHGEPGSIPGSGIVVSRVHQATSSILISGIIQMKTVIRSACK